MPKQIVCLCVFHLLSRVCLEPWLQVWVQAAGARGAPCTCCTEVGAESPGWEVMMLGTLTEENGESSLFHFIHN